MSEIILGESSEFAICEALIDGQPIGVWLDGQREVTIQKAHDELQKEANPEQRAKLVSALFFLRLGQLSEEQQKAAAQKIDSSVITHIEKMVFDEQNPHMKEFFQSWLEFQKHEIKIPFEKAKQIAGQFEIGVIGQALKNQSLNSQSQHILYQEYFIRLASQLTPEMKEKLPTHPKNFCLGCSSGQLIKIHRQMVNNAQKIQEEGFNLTLKAALEGKELPKMSFPLLQVYELEKRFGISLSKTELIEEQFRVLRALSVLKDMVGYPFLALSKEGSEKLSSRLERMVMAAEEALVSYRDLVNTNELSHRDIYGKLSVLTLYHQGKLFEGDSLKKALNFYCSKSPASPEEGIRIIKSLCSAARVIGTENPAAGEKLLNLIKSAYVDEQLYLSWFSSEEWKVCRAQALLELGKLAHTLKLSCEQIFMDEAIRLIENISYSKKSELQKEYGYSHSKKTWFIL